MIRTQSQASYHYIGGATSGTLDSYGHHKNFHESLEVDNFMGRDDVRLCEGLLNIFLKPNCSRHVITYK